MALNWLELDLSFRSKQRRCSSHRRRSLPKAIANNRSSDSFTASFGDLTQQRA